MWSARSGTMSAAARCRPNWRPAGFATGFAASGSCLPASSTNAGMPPGSTPTRFCPASHATVVRFLDGVIRRERPTLRVFDVNLRQDFFSREVLEESMARCNILKISDEEAPRVAGCLTGCPAADPGGLCRELLDRRENLEMVILTEGAEGSRVFTRNRISAYVIPRGERVRPVDTVGAGDSFTAAFCAMLAAGYDIWPAQAFASKVAAFVCSCAGATPEYPAAAKTEFSGNL